MDETLDAIHAMLLRAIDEARRESYYPMSVDGARAAAMLPSLQRAEVEVRTAMHRGARTA